MKKPCTECDGKGRYEGATGIPYGPLTRPVPCPYRIGRKVLCTDDFRNGKQVMIMAAVRSRAEFSRITGISAHCLKDYSSETGNADDIEAAMAKPGTVFWRLLDDRDVYREKDW